ncbi:MAG: DUF1343 domain-containing protein [Mucilaginibacter polytrichastri]|nr:DUF1343 domain-containing protein [Mucilaginibacter polytrichastri]
MFFVREFSNPKNTPVLNVLIRTSLYLFLAISFSITACGQQKKKEVKTNPDVRDEVRKLPEKETVIVPAADQPGNYLFYLKDKNLGMVVNPTSVIGTQMTPLVDYLVEKGYRVKKIFGPEHGFRGAASAGVAVENETDKKTGVPVISLYGKHETPGKDDLAGIDLMVFDIQDVGARFYTYIYTLARVMEACAKYDKELLILDRPNPMGFSVDGPILDMKLRSGVGMHPIPITHGMTVAEYAQMINGEGWLPGGMKCRIKVVPVKNYTHQSRYELPVKPSPNLNTAQSIRLYPSLCLFEGTIISQGRGTQFPFTVLGNPDLKDKYPYVFTPESISGMAEDPLHNGKKCYGLDLRKYNTDSLLASGKINLKWLIELYQAYPYKHVFFDYQHNKQMGNFDKLSGTENLRLQIIAGKSEDEIRKSWEPGLSRYKSMRKKYLIYP